MIYYGVTMIVIGPLVFFGARSHGEVVGQHVANCVFLGGWIIVIAEALKSLGGYFG